MDSGVFQEKTRNVAAGSSGPVRAVL